MDLSRLLDLARRSGATDLYLLPAPSGRRTLLLRTPSRVLRREEGPDPERVLEELRLDPPPPGGHLERAAGRDGLRLRVSAVHAEGGLALALRILSDTPRTLEDLGYTGQALALVRRWLSLRSGLLLITGPTGSGKSTTAHALIREYAARGRIALTMEDPVEVLHPPYPSGHVAQWEVGRDIPSFHEGLVRALRMRPDVLLVGELRERSTIALALEAAVTGHLVLATAHAGSVYEAPTRILDAFPPQERPHVALQLSTALRGLLFQHLLSTPAGPAPAAEVIDLSASRTLREVFRNYERWHLDLQNLYYSHRPHWARLGDALADLIAQGRLRPQDLPEPLQDLLPNPENRDARL